MIYSHYMNVVPLFSTSQRQRILFHILDRDEKINMNAIARELRVSLGLVHMYVTILKKEGLIKDGRLTDTPYVRSLKVLRNLDALEKARLVNIIRKHVTQVKGIGVMGSFGNGTNMASSDLDVWIKVDVELDEESAATLSKAISKATGREVDLLVVTPERLDGLRSTAESLYHSLYHSIVLWGDGF